MDGTAAFNKVAASLEVNLPKKKRKRVRGSQKTQAYKRQKASEQVVARDRERHSSKAAYAASILKVGALKHSAPAYAGNMTRQGGVALPQELGCGYRLVKCTPG